MAKLKTKRPDEIDTLIGQRIRMARLTANLSQENLGEALGITFQQIQKYEKGVNRVGSGRMVKIAEVLKRPIAWFSEGSGHDAPKGAPTDVLTRLGQTREGVKLATAFLAIKSHDMRASILQTAQAAAA